MDAPTFGSDLRNRLARTAAMTYPTGIVGPRCCASLSLQANPTPRMEFSVDDRLLPSVYLLSSAAANRTTSGDGLSIEPDFRPEACRQGRSSAVSGSTRSSFLREERLPAARGPKARPKFCSASVSLRVVRKK